MKLTNNERVFLMKVINELSPENQIMDNFSNGGMEEATQVMGSKHAAAGLIGSLTAKGVGDMDGDLFWLNEDKIFEVYEELFNV